MIKTFLFTAVAVPLILTTKPSIAETIYRVKGTVSEGILNMRDGPGQRHKIVAVLPAGTGSLTIKKCESPDDGVSQFSWCLVEMPGAYNSTIEGWVSQGSLETGSSPATAEFPIVFEQEAEMKPIGLLYPDEGELRQHLKHRCYYIGDGGPDIEFDDYFLEHYKRQGFSRRSLCMALMSGIRYNPETGRRLATYIRKFSNKDADIYPELPIAVPECFRNGTPYSDCTFRYDLLFGTPLGPDAMRRYREIGERLKAALRNPTRRKNFKYFEDGEGDNSLVKGMILIGAAQEGLQVDEISAVSFYDYSDEFPEGFGYALYANGGSAPSLSAEVVRTSDEPGRRRRQMNPARIRELLTRN